MKPASKDLDLSARASVRVLLERFALRADKAFGQNFLVDEAMLAKIIAAAELSPGDRVLEVGPGLGVLTRALAQTGASISSVELDRRLLPLLAETLEGFDNVHVIHDDALRFDLTSLPQNSVMVANLAYNIATPMVMRALESGHFRRLVFLVQKEVAERFCASPGIKAYAALSVMVRYFGKAKRLFDVKPASFMPPPGVMSSVVRIDVHNTTPNPAFANFVHGCFRYRRKTLRKNLLLMGFLLEDVQAALFKVNFGDTLRAEALELDDFENLFQLLV